MGLVNFFYLHLCNPPAVHFDDGKAVAFITPDEEGYSPSLVRSAPKARKI
jgi:hypothetical protein